MFAVQGMGGFAGGLFLEQGLEELGTHRCLSQGGQARLSVGVGEAVVGSGGAACGSFPSTLEEGPCAQASHFEKLPFLGETA